MVPFVLLLSPDVNDGGLKTMSKLTKTHECAVDAMGTLLDLYEAKVL